MLKETLTSSFTAKIAAGMMKPKLMQMKSKMDYSEYGGAALFGLKAPVIKAHGSSDENAIFHAIRQARDIVKKTFQLSFIKKFKKKTRMSRNGGRAT